MRIQDQSWIQRNLEACLPELHKFLSIGKERRQEGWVEGEKGGRREE